MVAFNKHTIILSTKAATMNLDYHNTTIFTTNKFSYKHMVTHSTKAATYQNMIVFTDAHKAIIRNNATIILNSK